MTSHFLVLYLQALPPKGYAARAKCIKMSTKGKDPRKKAREQMRETVILCASILGLAGCVPANEPEVTRHLGVGPPVAEDGSCWGRDVSPATIETVTHQVLVQPAQIDEDGTVRSGAIYRTETLQRIVDERKELWFETPCAVEQTPDFIASLQRALKARGVYSGAVTGKMDGRTRAAVRAYQRNEGLDSGILSIAAARRLGLVRAPSPS